MKEVFPGSFAVISVASVSSARPPGLSLRAASAEVAGLPAAEWPEGAWQDQRHSALLAAEVTGGDFVAELDAADLMVRATDVAGPADERWLTALGKSTAAGVTTAAPTAAFPNGRFDTLRWRVCRIGTTYHVYSLSIAPVILPWPFSATPVYEWPDLSWRELYSLDRPDLAGAVHVGVPLDRGAGGSATVISGLRFGHVTAEADCTAPLD